MSLKFETLASSSSGCAYRLSGPPMWPQREEHYEHPWR